MDRFVTVVSDLQDTDAAAMAALAETIDPEAGQQIRLTLVRKTEKDILCVVVNHMICDGAGLKEFLYLLASLHNQLYAQPDYIPVLTAGPRSALTVLKRLSPREKLQTLFTRYDLSRQRVQPVYRLQGCQNRPIFTRIVLQEEEFTALKRWAK